MLFFEIFGNFAKFSAKDKILWYSVNVNLGLVCTVMLFLGILYKGNFNVYTKMMDELVCFANGNMGD